MLTRLHSKPLVGVSSCLLGHAVRYDGTDKFCPKLNNLFTDVFEFIPFCPEAGAGLGIPRPTIEVVIKMDGKHICQVDNPDIDVTDDIIRYALMQRNALDQLHGYIFKARSPSCGIDDAPIRLENDLKAVNDGSGLFSDIVTQQCPDLAAIDEEDLDDKIETLHFVEQVFTAWRLQVLSLPGFSTKDLLKFHRSQRKRLMLHSPAHLPLLDSLAQQGDISLYRELHAFNVSIKPDQESVFEAVRKHFGISATAILNSGDYLYPWAVMMSLLNPDKNTWYRQGRFCELHPDERKLYQYLINN